MKQNFALKCFLSGELQRKKGAFEKAIEDYSKGESYRKHGSLKLAILDFNKSIELERGNKIFRFCRGLALLNAKRFHESIIDLEYGLSIPKHEKLAKSSLLKARAIIKELELKTHDLVDAGTVVFPTTDGVEPDHGESHGKTSQKKNSVYDDFELF